MKKLLYILTLLCVISFISCSDDLETNPTDRVAGEVLLGTPDGGQAVMNGIYRALYISGWGTAPQWDAENSGIMAYTMAADLMGEDHIMRESGQGWFYFDYNFDIRADYTHGLGRQYQSWNFFYTLINNANNIIAKNGVWSGEDPEAKAVLGQAYTMRAFAYYHLIQLFQQAYVEGADKPGVPIYKVPSTSKTEGAPRGTVEDVYELMNADIDSAVSYFKFAQAIDLGEGEAPEKPWARDHESYIDYYVANGMKARIALAQGVDYSRALDGAKEALKKNGLRVLPVADFLGWNNRQFANTLWGIEVIAAQSQGFESFYSHMDADAPGMYASQARRLIATGLYNQIPDTDERKKQWWRAPMAEAAEQSGNSMVSYCQLKFRFASVVTRTGDYLLMRMEEMLLIAAEAECRLGQYENARGYLKTLEEQRDPQYTARLAAMTNSNTYSTNTLDKPKTLMEEILYQRRVELWGEFPRVFDLKRLQLGYNRDYEGTNHTDDTEMTPAHKNFVYPIPQAEFDGNINMNQSKDQNPL